MDWILRDMKQAARQMGRAPMLTFVAVITIALGIGANTAIFSLFNALLLKPLPGREPGKLVTVYTADSSGPLYSASSYPDYVDFRDRNEVLSGLACYATQPVLLTTRDGESFRAIGEAASANYFDVLGLSPVYGRFFLLAEGTAGGGEGPVAVISTSLWQRKYAGNPSAVGQSINVNGQSFTIVGIAPGEMKGLMRGVAADVWTPMGMQPVLTNRPDALTTRGSRGILLVGRLKPGATLEEARANFSLIGQQLHSAYPNFWNNRKGEARPVSVLPESSSRVAAPIREPVTIFLSLLLGVVGLVLLIACANVANVQLSRAVVRQKEIAIRLALGASRRQILRQLLTESLMLALLAGLVGLGLAFLCLRTLAAIHLPLPVTIALEVSPDYRVLLFALGVSLLTGILFGLAPALRSSRPEQVDVLKDQGSASGVRQSRLRGALVVAQVALSLLLLIASGLFLRSLGNAEALNPGFDYRNALLFDLDLEASGYDQTRGQAFLDSLRTRLQASPQVESVSMATRLPLDLGWSRRSVEIEGYRFSQGEDREVHFSQASAGYFKAMRIPLAAGRDIAETDTMPDLGVAIVNQAFVRRFWPGQEPLGKRITTSWRRGATRVLIPFEVVGVARDGKYNSLGEADTPFIVYSSAQAYAPLGTVIVRTRMEPASLAETVRSTLRAENPALPILNLRTLESQLGVSLFPVRAAATLVGAMGLLALVLTAVGIYGVISFAVSHRTREIGIRMALGAQRADILSLILRQGMSLTLLGSGIGLLGALGITRFLTFLLYGISPLDPITFIGIPLILCSVAALATWIPARRAIAVDPLVALRHE